MAANRMIVWECADGTGYNVLLEAAAIPHQWHWADRTRNFPNRDVVDRYVQNCAGPDTLIVERSGRRVESVLPEAWIVPETTVYYHGANKWTPNFTIYQVVACRLSEDERRQLWRMADDDADFAERIIRAITERNHDEALQPNTY